jgi:hypothetical protein
MISGDGVLHRIAWYAFSGTTGTSLRGIITVVTLRLGSLRPIPQPNSTMEALTNFESRLSRRIVGRTDHLGLLDGTTPSLGKSFSQMGFPSGRTERRNMLTGIWFLLGTA